MQAGIVAGRPATVRGVSSKEAQGEANQAELRRNIGEFVGNVFYGTLLRQVQASTLKGKLLHGGRGEEVFRAQLHMELAKRMGQAPNDPIANKMYDSFIRARGMESVRPGGDEAKFSAEMEQGVE